MVLQVALPMIRFHLPMKQLVQILSVLLLPPIDGIEPQVDAGEVLIHILIDVGGIETQGAYLNTAHIHRGSIHLLLKVYGSRTTGASEPPTLPTPLPPTSPPSPLTRPP